MSCRVVLDARFSYIDKFYWEFESGFGIVFYEVFLA